MVWHDFEFILLSTSVSGRVFKITTPHATPTIVLETRTHHKQKSTHVNTYGLKEAFYFVMYGKPQGNRQYIFHGPLTKIVFRSTRISLTKKG